MNKISVSRQSGGFMQTRKGTRPLRVSTLLNKETFIPASHGGLWTEKLLEESEATKSFAESLAKTEGSEFEAEPEPKIDPILSRIAKEGSVREYIDPEGRLIMEASRRRGEGSFSAPAVYERLKKVRGPGYRSVSSSSRKSAVKVARLKSALAKIAGGTYTERTGNLPPPPDIDLTKKYWDPRFKHFPVEKKQDLGERSKRGLVHGANAIRKESDILQ